MTKKKKEEVYLVDIVDGLDSLTYLLATCIMALESKEKESKFDKDQVSNSIFDFAFPLIDKLRKQLGKL